MPATATAYFRVNEAMIWPVLAEPDQFLALFAPPAAENLWVLDADGAWVVRRREVPEGVLWSALAQLLEDGVISWLVGPAHYRLQYPLPVAALPWHPASRAAEG
jgi:hypothetical protein